MAVAFDVSEVVDFTERLRDASDNIEATTGEWLEGWADAVADQMREEVPVDEGDMKDSITVEMEGLSATIGPTNTDDQGRPIGFFVNYGAGNRSPNDFIGRTAAFARDRGADALDLGQLL